jgi:hypothetical protein
MTESVETRVVAYLASDPIWRAPVQICKALGLTHDEVLSALSLARSKGLVENSGLAWRQSAQT